MLKVLFSTTEVHPRDRFDYWHSVACKEIVRHDSVPESSIGFEAELRSGMVSDIGLILFTNSPMTATHSPWHVSRAESDDLFVCRQMTGKLALDQDGRTLVLEKGDFALLDPKLPYVASFIGGSSTLVVK